MGKRVVPCENYDSLSASERYSLVGEAILNQRKIIMDSKIRAKLKFNELKRKTYEKNNMVIT